MFIWKVPKLLPSKIIVTRLIAEMHWFLLLISDRVKLIIQRGHNKLLLKQKKKKKKRVSRFAISFIPITRSLSGYWH